MGIIESQDGLDWKGLRIGGLPSGWASHISVSGKIREHIISRVSLGRQTMFDLLSACSDEMSGPVGKGRVVAATYLGLIMAFDKNFPHFPSGNSRSMDWTNHLFRWIGSCKDSNHWLNIWLVISRAAWAQYWHPYPAPSSTTWLQCRAHSEQVRLRLGSSC